MSDSKGDFFVMVNLPKGGLTPIMNDDGNVRLFDTEEEAADYVNGNSFVEAFGGEIFERGLGVGV